MLEEALTAKQVIQFVSRSDAIAPIWVEDIKKLTKCQFGASLDTWQIGTVPSRLFRVVGIVIHTNFFDNDDNWRTVYVVDDGTGCVEINHTEYKKFVTPHWLAQSEERRQSAKAAPQLPTAPLPPMNPSHIPLGNWSIGRFTIRVKRGGVVEFDKVERLRSVQEEVNHWKQVMRLHETHYRRPFIIPPLLPPPEEVPLPPLSQRDRISGEALPKPLSNPAPPPPPVNEHLQSPTPLLPHPASIKSADLHFRTFTFYLAFFMRHDELSQTTPHASYSATPPLGYTFDYLRRVPDLRYLARRILLAEARRMTREYLVKRRALEPTDSNQPSPNSSKAGANLLRKPAPLTNEIMTKKIKDLFTHALRHLFGQGDIVAASGRSRPIPLEMSNMPPCSLSEYPSCLGQFRLWGPPPPSSNVEAAAPETKTRVSGLSSRKSWRVGLQDDDGPMDVLEPLPSLGEQDEDAEVYFVVTAELLSEGVLKAVTLLSRRRALGQHGGASPGEILATLIRSDERWRKMNEVRIDEALALLSRAKKVWNYMKDQWVLVGP